MKVIKKYDQGSPITTGGAGYIPAAQPSTEQLKNAANKLGEWFLKGMGNTWYEIDVPQNYLNSEWQLKCGGKINKKK